MSFLKSSPVNATLISYNRHEHFTRHLSKNATSVNLGCPLTTIETGVNWSKFEFLWYPWHDRLGQSSSSLSFLLHTSLIWAFAIPGSEFKLLKSLALVLFPKHYFQQISNLILLLIYDLREHCLPFLTIVHYSSISFCPSTTATTEAWCEITRIFALHCTSKKTNIYHEIVTWGI